MANEIIIQFIKRLNAAGYIDINITQMKGYKYNYIIECVKNGQYIRQIKTIDEISRLPYCFNK